MGINKVILIGNVGKDPVIKNMENDVSVATFPLATSETFKRKDGEKVTNTEWHNIVVWRGLAKVVENYVKKGSSLYIEGKITTRSWEKDGNKHYMTEIIASNIQMLGSKPKEDSAAAASTSNTDSNTPPELGEDDLPF